MLRLLLYLSALTCLTGAQQTFTGASEFSLGSCPIAFYGQKYDHVYVNFTTQNLLLCFGGFFKSGTRNDCLEVTPPDSQTARFQIYPRSSGLETIVLNQVRTIRRRMECFIAFALKFDGSSGSLALINFGTQSALNLYYAAIGSLVVHVGVSGNTVATVNVTNTPVTKVTRGYLDTSSCRHSGVLYTPGTKVDSPETCFSLICDDTAVLQMSECGPHERCQGNGSCIELDSRTTQGTTQNSRASQESMLDTRTTQGNLLGSRTTQDSMLDSRTTQDFTRDSRTIQDYMLDSRTTKDTLLSSRTTQDSILDLRTTRNSKVDPRTTQGSRTTQDSALGSRTTDAIQDSGTTQDSTLDSRTTQDSMLDSRTTQDSMLDSQPTQDSRTTWDPTLDSRTTEDAMLDSGTTREGTLDYRTTQDTTPYRPTRDVMLDSRTTEDAKPASRTTEDTLLGSSTTRLESTLDSRTTQDSMLHSRTTQDSKLDSRTTLDSMLVSRTTQDSTLDSRTTQDSTLDSRTTQDSTLDSRTTQDSTLDSRTTQDSKLDSRTTQDSTLDTRTTQDTVLGPALVLVCTVTGPAIINIYGQVIQVKDRCAYSLLSVPGLQVSARFRERHRRDVSFLDSVSLQLDGSGLQIHLEQGRRVLLNDSALTFTGSALLGGGVELSEDQTGVTAKVSLSNITTSVFFDGHTAQIHLEGPAVPSLLGLCGNSSRSLSEMRLPESRSTSCEMQYSDKIDRSINCSRVTERCNLLRGVLFSSCPLDPEPYITACRDTLCVYPALDGLNCQFLEAYARACSLNGSAALEDWRSHADCPPPKAFCQNSTCSAHEFCGEKTAGGETRCFCRALFAAKYRETDALGDPTVCRQNSASVFLANCLLEDKGIDYSMLHLKDQTCRGQMDQQNHMVTFSFNGSSCGTEVTTNNSHIIYRNAIMNQNGSSDIITRKDQFFIDLSCVQTKSTIRTSVLRLRTSSVVQTITSGLWNYTLTMKAFSNADRTQSVESNTRVLLDQRIWVELRTDGLDGDVFAVVTKSCWATETASPVGTPRYQLIQNGCGNPDDQTVQVESNGEGTSCLFSFNMFSFSGGSGDVNLHCYLQLCVRGEHTCTQDCGGARRRRAVRSRQEAASSD